jgi:hypothetical protein
MCYVGGTSRIYALNKQALPTLWPVQEGTYLIQIDMLEVEEVDFLLLDKPRCPLVNSVGDDIFTPMK